MEKRIKTLYIITIIAILAFLGMQIYWLYGRYEYSLSEYERMSYNTIIDTLEEINKAKSARSDTFAVYIAHQSNYNIDEYKEDGKQKIKATINSCKYSPHEVLGISRDRKLTKEENARAALLVSADSTLAEWKSQSFDVTDAPSEGAVWGAFKQIDNEFIWPLKVERVDSVLKKEGIKAEIELIVTDSTMWNASLAQHASVYNPSMVVAFPYSELERKSVLVTYSLPMSTIFDSMIDSLVFAFVLSVFLIVCLIWQIRTIRHLLKLDNVRNSFVHTMIHELKRPISTLKICLSSLANPRISGDEKSRGEIIDDCRTAVNNLSTYFSRLRDIMFNEASQIPLELESCRLHDIADSVIAKTTIPSGKEVEIVNNIAPDIDVVADSLHLSQILSNLVENAIKYSGERVHISLESEICTGGVAISVRDDGNGISESDMKQIFSKFYRSASAIQSGVPGVGLGLAYVKLLTEAHGGEVRVESRLGEGAVFTIKLPQE